MDKIWAFWCEKGDMGTLARGLREGFELKGPKAG
jgi:hypothetical protein